jgi:hypothetical protein
VTTITARFSAGKRDEEEERIAVTLERLLRFDFGEFGERAGVVRNERELRGVGQREANRISAHDLSSDGETAR